MKHDGEIMNLKKRNLIEKIQNLKENQNWNQYKLRKKKLSDKCGEKCANLTLENRV